MPTPGSIHGTSHGTTPNRSFIFNNTTSRQPFTYFVPFFCRDISENLELIKYIAMSGQVLVGGYNGNILASVEVIPHPSSSSCTIPNLPQPRRYHSISLLSGGRIVVCGGRIGSTNYNSNSCISWANGNDSWVPLYTMRYHNCPDIVV